MTHGARSLWLGLVGLDLNQTRLRQPECMTELPSTRGGCPGQLGEILVGYEAAHACCEATAALAFVCNPATSS